MARRYGSFLLRCWQLAGGRWRIDVEHVQSGTTTRVSSPMAAIAWITAQTSLTTSGPSELPKEVAQEL